MFTVNVGDYAITVQQGSLPAIYGDYKRHAKLCDEFSIRPHEGGELCFVSVSAAQKWPFLIVAQRFDLAEAGLDPAVLIAPDAHTLFVGAGRRVVGYRLDAPQRLFEHTVDAGFWEWTRHGDVVLMAGELELGAWDVHGKPLWNMPLQPAWDYKVTNGTIHLNVLGRRTSFGLREGPAFAALEK